MLTIAQRMVLLAIPLTDLRREVCLPLDLAFSISMDGTSAATHRGYMERLHKNLKMAYEKAQYASDARDKMNNKNYNLRVQVHDH